MKFKLLSLALFIESYILFSDILSKCTVELPTNKLFLLIMNFLILSLLYVVSPANATGIKNNNKFFITIFT